MGVPAILARWGRLLPLTWSRLRGIGNAPLAKLTIISPFIPFIFDLFDNIVEISVLSTYLEAFKINWPQPRLASLYFFYYGLSCLGIASIIYSIFCPRLIKDYASFFDYINVELRIKSSIQSPTIGPHAHYDMDLNLLELTRKNTEIITSKSMKEEYVDSDHSMALARTLVFIFYFTGFLLCGIPAVSKFVAVTSRLLDKVAL